jgi:hypothetical protein
MNVPEITAVKNLLDSLKSKELIESWELPYENLLTRLSAAIFFVTPMPNVDARFALDELSNLSNFSYRVNSEKKLSSMDIRVTFSKEELEKNQAANALK